MVLDAVMAALALTASGDGPAQDRERGSAYEACITRTAGVQHAVVECLSGENGRLLKVLEDAFLQRLTVVTGSARARLVRDQRHWTRRRDRECDRRYWEEAPAQNAPLLYNLCLIELNSTRIGELGGMRR